MTMARTTNVDNDAQVGRKKRKNKTLKNIQTHNNKNNKK